MSHKKHQLWVMMPVLGILLTSPKELDVKFGRHIASGSPVAQVQQEKKEDSQTPKLDELLKTVTIPARPSPANLTSDMLKEDISKLLSRISKAEEFDKKTVEKPALDHLREEIKASAIELIQVENSIKDLVNPEDEGDIRPRIGEAKIHLEASIKDLEETEILVAARSTKPVPETPATQVAEPTKPVSKPEAERAPSVVSEETKPETSKPEVAKPDTAKPETAKAEKDPILCALEDQNKLLQMQLQSFVQQQGLIMTQLMQLSQMVMMQNMYRTPDTFNYHQMYQYNQPAQVGNWVYYPGGLQPIMPGQTVPQSPAQAPVQAQTQPSIQQNIFGVNPYGQFPSAPSYGAYGMQPPVVPFQQPQMMNPGGQWGLQPQFNHAPGSFGLDTMSFNFGQQMPAQGQATGQFI